MQLLQMKASAFVQLARGLGRGHAICWQCLQDVEPGQAPAGCLHLILSGGTAEPQLAATQLQRRARASAVQQAAARSFSFAVICRERICKICSETVGAATGRPQCAYALVVPMRLVLNALVRFAPVAFENGSQKKGDRKNLTGGLLQAGGTREPHLRFWGLKTSSVCFIPV